MKTAAEIRSNLENIKYYQNEINRLLHDQVQADIDSCIASNLEYGADRYNRSTRGQNLAIAYSYNSEIELAVQIIETNIKNAEARDKDYLTQETINA